MLDFTVRWISESDQSVYVCLVLVLGPDLDLDLDLDLSGYVREWCGIVGIS